MKERRAIDVPLVAVQETENFPQMKHLGSVVCFQNDSKHIS